MPSRPQADPEAAARRAAARRERVTGGLDELSRWLRDQVRSRPQPARPQVDEVTADPVAGGGPPRRPPPLGAPGPPRGGGPAAPSPPPVPRPR